MYLIIYLPANIPTLCNFPHHWGRKPMKQNIYFFFILYPKHLEQSKYICLEEEICPDEKKKEFQ